MEIMVLFQMQRLLNVNQCRVQWLIANNMFYWNGWKLGLKKTASHAQNKKWKQPARIYGNFLVCVVGRGHKRIVGSS